VSADKLQNELSKVKKELTKQVKTAQEEAQFDSLQMVQSDMVQVANQQKDLRFKVTELSGHFDGAQTRFEEAIKRLTNREKE